MEIPAPVVQKVTGALVETGVNLLVQAISSFKITPRVSPTEEAEKPCSTCLIHQHVVLARGYIEGTVNRLNTDGTVPAGLGGTIGQARQHLHEATMEIPGVMGAHPMIDAACQQLSTLLPEIAARLERVDSHAEWDAITDRLRHAENIAYAIPEAIYRREYPKAEPTRSVIVELSPEDYRIIETVNKVKSGEMSAQDFRNEVAGLLAPGDK